jgi:hypothetical protein
MAKPAFPQQGRILKCYLDNIRTPTQLKENWHSPFGIIKPTTQMQIKPIGVPLNVVKAKENDFC